MCVGGGGGLCKFAKKANYYHPMIELNWKYPHHPNGKPSTKESPPLSLLPNLKGAEEEFPIFSYTSK